MKNDWKKSKFIKAPSLNFPKTIIWKFFERKKRKLFIQEKILFKKKITFFGELHNMVEPLSTRENIKISTDPK